MEITIDLGNYYEWYSKKLEKAMKHETADDVDELNTVHMSFLHLLKQFEVKGE